MKLKLAITFIILFIISAIGIQYSKDYFFKDNSLNNKDLDKNFSPKLFIDFLQKNETQLYNLNGKSIDKIKVLGDLKEANKIRIFHFWASWCEPCMNEMPELIKFEKKINQNNKKNLNNKKIDNQSKNQIQNVQIYLISLDSDLDEITKFIKIFPEIVTLEYSHFWDKDHLLSSYFSIDKLPKTIISYPDGSLRVTEGSLDWDKLSF